MSSVLVVDDHELFRKGLIAALSEVVADGIDWLEAGSLRETLAILAARGPVSLVVLDLKLPDTQGFGALSALRQAYPQQRVLVISASADDAIHHHVLALGAWGFAGKSATATSLRDLLAAALSLGTRRADQGVSDPAHARAARDNPVGYAHVQRLGERHLQVLELLLRGCSNQQIVTETGLALGTVKNYVSAVLICFEARSRAHLLSLFK
ncbi:response regulator transcription factor [Reyranella sp. CPCC 100927]|uniref:response regulator transcription factor n=1 Tax=Reyranella sp. CPCC 100927 TaxID=2599616 RepID=UPI0011B42D08|nr:response regulator transcription factor [Reyranella sp. CPCC 100927]TWT15205.1 response regulator transcription factor [Reyranella sp. CPCC 100927]